MLPLMFPLPRLAVVVIDEDADVRRVLGQLLGSYGHLVHVFPSPVGYLDGHFNSDCVVVGIGHSGIALDLEERLRRRGLGTPLRDGPQQAHRCYIRRPLEGTGVLEAIGSAMTWSSFTTSRSSGLARSRVAAV
jgi:hypothetical protein